MLAAVFELIALPAALLLGPMIAGIVMGSNGGRIRPPRLPVLAAQTVVGCLVARAITGDIVVAFLKDWPLFLSVVIAIVATSGAIGWVLTRLKALPGTTAVWGTAPGGASVMMVMSGAFGADRPAGGVHAVPARRAWLRPWPRWLHGCGSARPAPSLPTWCGFRPCTGGISSPP